MGDVFTADLIETWIDYKTNDEILGRERREAPRGASRINHLVNNRATAAARSASLA